MDFLTLIQNLNQNYWVWPNLYRTQWLHPWLWTRLLLKYAYDSILSSHKEKKEEEIDEWREKRKHYYIDHHFWYHKTLQENYQCFFFLSNILIKLENKFLHLHKHNWNKTCYPKWCSCFQCTVISYQSKIISSAKTRRTQNELGANILYNSRKK